jgi:hypothetical protein
VPVIWSVVADAVTPRAKRQGIVRLSSFFIRDRFLCGHEKNLIRGRGLPMGGQYVEF